MNTYLKQEIIKGNCILLLGAGASFNSLDSRKRPILMGEELSKELCAEIGITHQPGQLPKVYEIAKRKLGAKLVNFLEDKFSGTTPSNELNRIARYVWQRIYTLNIDDATEIAFQRNSNQTVKTLNRTDPWKEIDQQLARLDIIKLNGCINRPTDGFIFSPLGRR